MDRCFSRMVGVVTIAILATSVVGGGGGGGGGGHTTRDAVLGGSTRTALLGTVRATRLAARFTRQFTSDLTGFRSTSRARAVTQKTVGEDLLRYLAGGESQTRQESTDGPAFAPSLGLYYTQDFGLVPSKPLVVQFYTDKALTQSAGTITVIVTTTSAHTTFDITGGNFPEQGEVTDTFTPDGSVINVTATLSQPGTANQFSMNLARSADGQVTGEMQVSDATGKLSIFHPIYTIQGEYAAAFGYESTGDTSGVTLGTVSQKWQGAGRVTIGSNDAYTTATYDDAGAGTVESQNGKEDIANFDQL